MGGSVALEVHNKYTEFYILIMRLTMRMATSPFLNRATSYFKAMAMIMPLRIPMAKAKTKTKTVRFR